MQLIYETKEMGFWVADPNTRVHCKVFEDNTGAIEIAKNHKFRPRTKHINVRLHHFRDYVARGDISIHKIDTKEQPADMLTKPLPLDLLKVHRERERVMG